MKSHILFLKKISSLKFIIIMVLFNILTVKFCSLVNNLYGSYIGATIVTENPLSNCSFFNKLFIGCFFAPFFETFIFQFLVIELLLRVKFFKNNIYLIILLSALTFGLSHDRSYIYMLETFIIGLSFAYSYLIFKDEIKNKSKYYPYLIVVCIHSIYNFIVITLTTLLS